ncbi:MAG: hypothetical protein GC159_12910 [Phycisphaera sp.]|nr:hypothetical protein [Phycisphaera sp.]
MTNEKHNLIKARRAALIALLALCLTPCAPTRAADDKPAADDPAVGVKEHRHLVKGLFSKEREADLREAIGRMPDEIELVTADYQTNEAVFRYDQSKVFKGAKPQQVIEWFNQRLQQVSDRTFGIKPLPELPADKLTRVEIHIAGLDCKACSYGVYLTMERVDGVEVATASFHDGLATALIDPSKTDRAKLIEALKKREVDVKDDDAKADADKK